MDFEIIVLLILFFLSIFLFVKYLDFEMKIDELYGKRMRKERSATHLSKGFEEPNFNRLEENIKKLQEEVFLLKNDIKFDPCYQEIVYDYTQSASDNVYHVEISYFINYFLFDNSSSRALEMFYSDFVKVKIMLDNEIVKELEIENNFIVCLKYIGI